MGRPLFGHPLRSSESGLKNELVTLKQQLELAQEQKKHAEETYKQAKNSFDVRLRELEGFNKDIKEQAAQRIQNLEQMHDREKKDLIAMNEKERHSRLVEIENLRVSVSNLEKKLAKAELTEVKINSENKEYKDKIQRLNNELKSLNTEYSNQQERLRGSEKQLSTKQGEFKQLQIVFSDYKKDAEKVREQSLVNREKVIKLEEELKNLKHKKTDSGTKR